MLKDSPCVMQTLRAASRLVTRRYEAALRAQGLTASQFTILQALYDQEGQSLGELSETLGFDQTTTTRLLTSMIRSDLLTLETSQADRRRKHLRLTSAGRAKIRAALPLWQDLQAESLTHVSGRDWSTIRHFLHHLSQA